MFKIIGNPEIFRNRVQHVFSLGCFALAIYYGVTQVIRYIENNDLSTITQQTFNDVPNNKYPTFTICLKGKDVYWKNEKMLLDQTGLSSVQYVDLLEGKGGFGHKYNEKSRLYEKENINVSRALQMDTSSIFLLKSDVIVGTHFFAENNLQSTHYGYGKETANLQDAPFHIGHRNPDESCFTRDSNDATGLIRVYDEVLLNRTLLHPGNNMNLEVKIIFHYPGQLVENIERPTYHFFLEEIKSNPMFWEGKIPQVSVLKNRPDSIPSCYDGNVSDDKRLRNKAITMIDCIPMHWKDIDIPDSQKEFCESKEKFKMLNTLISSRMDILDTRSCTSMDILVIQSKAFRAEDKHITIKISYEKNQYQETENVQDFSFESFFSSLGGFIGIFLGYSMLQIPELITEVHSYVERIIALRIKG